MIGSCYIIRHFTCLFAVKTRKEIFLNEGKKFLTILKIVHMLVLATSFIWDEDAWIPLPLAEWVYSSFLVGFHTWFKPFFLTYPSLGKKKKWKICLHILALTLIKRPLYIMMLLPSGIRPSFMMFMTCFTLFPSHGLCYGRIHFVLSLDTLCRTDLPFDHL